MKPKKVIKHVMKEINAIKKHATKEQIDKLNFKELRPSEYNNCIYGQMTGNCESKASLKLIRKCCTRTVDAIGDLFQGSYTASRSKRTNENFSLLERFIYMESQNNEDIIAYLRGEKKELELTIETEWKN